MAPGTDRRSGRDTEFTEYYAARGTAMRATAYLMCGDWHLPDDPCASECTLGTEPRAGVYLPVSTLRAGLYGRNSKDLDKSIDDQLVEGRQAADDHGWPIVAEYSDGVSASRFGHRVRKDWQRLLDDLDEGLLDLIITWEPSRADRDLETWVGFVAKCRAKGVLIHITGEDDTLDARNPSHWRRLIEGGLDAAMESEKISKRVRRGVAAAAVAGGFHGDCPFGYERVIVGERQTRHGPKPIKVQRPHPEHAPIVREIFERIGLNDPITTIVADLTERKIPAPAGAAWHRNTIRKIVFNVAYLGQRSHNGEVHDGTWPELVTPKVFHAAGKVLGDRRRKTSQPGVLKHLLSYVATTPCGSVVHFMGESRGRHARYHCVADGCTAIGVAEAEEYVSRLVVKRCCEPDVRELFTDDDEAAQRAQDEAAALRTKLDEATASFLKPKDGISAERLAAIERELAPRIRNAELRSVSRKAPMALLALLDAAPFGAAKVRPEWDGFPVAARREILRLLFADIRVGKPARTLTRWSSDADRLAAATARMQVTWRTPDTPLTETHEPGAQPGAQSGAKAGAKAGGARAQRRRQTSIELASG
jgi:DNA invertase Pin-like site-specific DNA recombinase